MTASREGKAATKVASDRKFRPPRVTLVSSLLALTALLVLIAIARYRKVEADRDWAVPREAWPTVDSRRMGGSGDRPRRFAPVVRGGYEIARVPVPFTDIVDAVPSVARSGSIYVLEKGGRVRQLDPGASKEIARFELGAEATAMYGTSGGLVFHLAEREEILKVSVAKHEVSGLFRIRGLTHVSARHDHGMIVAVAGNPGDPTDRRFVVMRPQTPEVLASWTLDEAAWQVGSGSDRVRPRGIDAAVFDAHGGSIFVLDGRDLWRLSCCGRDELRVLERIPRAVAHEGGRLESSGKYVGAFANRFGLSTAPDEGRASVYLRDLVGPAACARKLSFGRHAVTRVRVDKGNAFVATDDSTLHHLRWKPVRGERCGRVPRERGRIGLGTGGVSMADFDSRFHGEQLLIWSDDALLLARPVGR